MLQAGRRWRARPSRSAPRSRCRRTSGSPSSQSEMCMCMPLPLSPKSGLGMNVTVLLCLRGDVLDDVLVHQHVVGHRHQRRETAYRFRTGRRWPPRDAALRRPGRTRSWSASFRCAGHELIGGRDREVAFLVAQLVAEVRAFHRGRGSSRLRRCRGSSSRSCGVLVEADVVEDEELGFRARSKPCRRCRCSSDS